MTIGIDPFTRLQPSIRHHIANTLGWQSLRPLQEHSIVPLMAGDDALLLAPTAGGKTEAVTFPILSALDETQADGLSVLYICPIKALLNNLHPRLERYTSWVGRTAQIRHGDTTPSVRAKQVLSPPDILLTTPESLEAVMVSTKADEQRLFANVQTVIIDEVHAFAGDDRGWHLLALLERLCELSVRRIQRVGLSATVGNARDLLTWLQGSHPTAKDRPGHVIAPGVDLNLPTAASEDVDPEVVRQPAPTTAGVDMHVDYVGTMANAATLISKLHVGEKRLVFADSRSTVEQLAGHLRDLDVNTFVSHSSLSLDERRQAEQAFAEAKDCVIVATSTLELGIDVGDLDRVLQIGAPGSVASMLQRLGRAGRRAGTSRNMLFIAIKDEDLLAALSMCLLWSEGYVEPVHGPPRPHHIAAQQLLGMTLQRGRVVRKEWHVPIQGSGAVDRQHADAVAKWLVDVDYLTEHHGVLAIGPQAEKRYGKRHFMDILAVFSAPPQFTVRLGREDIGTIDPVVLTTPSEGPRRLTLAGRGWLVTHIDWRRKVVQVEPSDAGGTMRWMSSGAATSYALANAERRVLLGMTPLSTTLTKRAVERLGSIREARGHLVSPIASVVDASGAAPRWWTFAGLRANLTLAAALNEVADGLVDGDRKPHDRYVSLDSEATSADLRSALVALKNEPDLIQQALPEVSEEAVQGLKFYQMLPPELARETVATRMVDTHSARTIATRPIQSWHEGN